MAIRVASVQSEFDLVLNVGSNEGINVGQRFLVYSLGEEVLDPETGESLGTLEVISGTGKVVHVQERLCVLRSDMTAKPRKTITSLSNPLFRLAGDRITEELIPPDPIGFANPSVGAFARPI
jgi:hypothetical protein